VDEFSNTLIVIASDHGEAFMQHGEIGHNSTVYEEMIHVPMIVHAPASMGFKARGIETPVEMVDLFPTFAEIFSLPVRRPLHGKSLLGLLSGVTAPHKDVHFSQTSSADFLSVRKGDLKVIAKRRAYSFYDPVELYDLAADPDERRNLLEENSNIPAHRDLLESYRRRYYLRQDECAVEQEPGAAPELTDEDMETLKSLGYFE